MTPDAQHCLERLEWHADRLSNLIQLLGGETFVSGRDDDVAREFYRAIRSALKDEYEAGKAKGATLSKPEQAWLQPTLFDSHAALTVPPNGPAGRDLFTGALKACGTIDRAIRRLELREGRSPVTDDRYVRRDATRWTRTLCSRRSESN